jgi:hypothetical protein
MTFVSKNHVEYSAIVEPTIFFIILSVNHLKKLKICSPLLEFAKKSPDDEAELEKQSLGSETFCLITFKSCLKEGISWLLRVLNFVKLDASGSYGFEGKYRSPIFAGLPFLLCADVKEENCPSRGEIVEYVYEIFSL